MINGRLDAFVPTRLHNLVAAVRLLVNLALLYRPIILGPILLLGLIYLRLARKFFQVHI